MALLFDPDDLGVFGEFAPSGVVAGLHTHQLGAYHGAGERFEAWLAGRQGGKTTGGLAWLLGGDLGQVSLYFARTIGNAWDIMAPVAHELNAAYNLELEVNKGDCQIVEPNGHVIQIYGIKDMSAAEGLRGRKFRRILGDELGTFDSELIKYSVESVIQPTLLKHRGEMRLVGTPGFDPDPEDYWYQITGDPASGVEGKWPTHRWTLFDNPYIPHELVIKDILKANNWTLEHPTFRREYLAQWVADRGTLPFANWDGRFYPEVQEGATVLAVDFGYHPCPTAFVVLRMEKQPVVTVLRAFSVERLTMHEIAGIIKQLQTLYRPNWMVADEGALGKGYGATLRDEFHLQIEAADKRDAVPRILTLQGMLQNHTLQLTLGAEELAKEWKVLPWAADMKGLHGRYKHDCSDATMYGLTKMLQTMPYTPPLDLRTQVEREAELARARARAAAERSSRGTFRL